MNRTEIYGEIEYRTLPDGSMQFRKRMQLGMDGKMHPDDHWYGCMSPADWERWHSLQQPVSQGPRQILSDLDRERIAAEVAEYKARKAEEERTREAMEAFRKKLKQSSMEQLLETTDLLFLGITTTGPDIEHQIVEIAAIRTSRDGSKVLGHLRLMAALENWAEIEEPCPLLQEPTYKEGAVSLFEALKRLGDLCKEAVLAGDGIERKGEVLRRHYLRLALQLPFPLSHLSKSVDTPLHLPQGASAQEQARAALVFYRANRRSHG